jgi:DNA-binding MarR family transcriptional regulator
LLAKGWIERRRDPSDTRRVQLLLKPQGVAHTRPSRRTVERAVTDALDAVGDANVRAARKVLIEIAQRLDDR